MSRLRAAREFAVARACGALEHVAPGLAPWMRVPEEDQDLGVDALPIVIQGGLVTENYLYEPLKRALQRYGFEVYVTRLEQHGLAPVERDATSLLYAIGRARRATGVSQVNILAHSKGGISARYLMQRMDGASLVQNLITVGTPHNGIKPLVPIPARLSSFEGVPLAIRQLNADSTLIRALNTEFPSWVESVSHEHPLMRIISITSWMSGLPFDGVVPAYSSRLPEIHPWVRNLDLREGPGNHISIVTRNQHALRTMAYLLARPRRS